MKSTRLHLESIPALSTIPRFVYGAEEDNSGSGSAGKADDDKSESQDQGSGSSSTSANDGDSNSDGLSPKEKAAVDEKDRHFRERQRAEAERDELKAWKDEQERKSNTDLENAQKDLQAAKDDNTKLADQVRSLAVENAFLRVNGVTWHNPAAALKQVDLSDVKFDNDGRPDTAAVKAAVDALAKSDPYLVKTETTEDKSKDKKTSTGKAPTGTSKDKDDVKTRNASLLAKYPGLRSHG